MTTSSVCAQEPFALTAAANSFLDEPTNPPDSSAKNFEELVESLTKAESRLAELESEKKELVSSQEKTAERVEGILKDLDKDAKAKEKNYDNRITCSLLAGYPGPFQVEGLAFAQWMDACNAYCYEVIQDIQEGSRAVPSFEELSSEFPALVW